MQSRRLPFISTQLALIGLLVVSAFAPIIGRAQESSSLSKATAWLLTQRDVSGGFVGFSGEQDPTTTALTLLALVAARDAGEEVDVAPTVTYLSDNALVFAQTGPGEAALFVLALLAAGENPTNFNEVSPLSIVQAVSRTASGIVAGSVYSHALITLALAAATGEAPAALLDGLRSSQGEDGSWSYDGATTAGAGDTNTTALVIQAFVAAGSADDPAIVRALAYLTSARTQEGGYVYQVVDGAKADANSTALALQAMIATGADPKSAEFAATMTALQAFQNDSGAFHYSPDMTDDNLFATIQAIPALAGRTLPLTPAGSGS